MTSETKSIVFSFLTISKSIPSCAYIYAQVQTGVSFKDFVLQPK
jgi:hypothetical protein